MPRLLARSPLWWGGLPMLCCPLVSSLGGWVSRRRPQKAMRRCPSQWRRPPVCLPILCGSPGSPVNPVLLPHRVLWLRSWVLRSLVARSQVPSSPETAGRIPGRLWPRRCSRGESRCLSQTLSPLAYSWKTRRWL